MNRLLSAILIISILLLSACAAPTSQPAPPGPPRPPPPGVTYIYPEESSTSSAPAPRPALTSAEQEYVTTFANHSAEVNNAVKELIMLLGATLHYGNVDWTLKTAAWLATIRTLYDKALEVEPPDSMTHIHSKYIQSMEPLNTMAKRLPQEIDEGNPHLLDETATEIETWAFRSCEAEELMLKFKETPTYWRKQR